MLASPAAGGAEILIRNLCAEFVEQGHPSHILFMSNAENVGNPAGFERTFLASLSDMGITSETMTPNAFRNTLSASRQLRRSAKAFQPDVVHIHLARGLMCRGLSGLRLPTVYTHHNVTTNFAPWMFRFFDRSVDRYVAIGEACRQLLATHVRKPITSIPNGVPSTFSRAGARLSPRQESLVLAVGNLNPKKDYPNLVEAAAMAFPRLDALGKRVRFAIAGEGPERLRIEQLLEERGIEDRFELLGARSDVAALMQQADLLVNSSEHEGLPITLIEAAMSGLPIVATDVGGNAEVVLDNRTGFTVPPARPDLLADGICRLLSDSGTYRSFSAAAIAHSRQFRIDACAAAHLDLYRTLLVSREPSGNIAAK